MTGYSLARWCASSWASCSRPRWLELLLPQSDRGWPRAAAHALRTRLVGAGAHGAGRMDEGAAGGAAATWLPRWRLTTPDSDAAQNRPRDAYQRAAPGPGQLLPRRCRWSTALPTLSAITPSPPRSARPSGRVARRVHRRRTAQTRRGHANAALQNVRAPQDQRGRPAAAHPIQCCWPWLRETPATWRGGPRGPRRDGRAGCPCCAAAHPGLARCTPGYRRPSVRPLNAANARRDRLLRGRPASTPPAARRAAGPGGRVAAARPGLAGLQREADRQYRALLGVPLPVPLWVLH